MAVDILSQAKHMFSTGPALAFTAVVVIAATVYTVFRHKQMKSSSMKSSAASNKTSQPASKNYEKELEAHATVAESMVPGRWSLGESHPDGDNGVQEVKRGGVRDAMEFCEHIPGEVKRVKARLAQEKVEQEMSADAREEERQMQRQQLESIFSLLKEQESKYGIASMEDMQEQMKLYTQ